MTFAVGSLVNTRGREWVVLPGSEPDMLILKPLVGIDDEVTGVYVPLENVQHAQFELPDPTQPGDYRSCRLLRNAARLGFRSSAGPFRSFGSLAFEPRPYQLVPLLMALKLDPIRILIADDVGVGKTIEAGLIARELLERGEEQRLAVLCPPHLAEQWQKELLEKFHISAELVLSGTASRLERSCGFQESLFDVFHHVIVSTDFIKSDRRRDEFLRTCPDLVIVDEAHTFAFSDRHRGGRHQRNQLLRGLAEKPERHLILLTATPHSGKEDNFRSLLSFLNKDFASVYEDKGSRAYKEQRKRLADQFVQRRRGDIKHYLDIDTPFPDREEKEISYKLSAKYKKFFDRVWNYARETVLDDSGTKLSIRVRWWSALALLRSIASSPAAAAATLRSRAASADTETPEAADEIGRHSVLDLDVEDGSDVIDVVPGSDAGEFFTDDQKNHRKLLEMARQADALFGREDEKIKVIAAEVKQLLKEGFSPIVFCRFIPTAEYLAEELRKKLPNKVNVTAVTGTLPSTEREQRVLTLSESPERVLVATDCLSEGINLQEHFNAVIHYDLSWNPTRHEQREGRVDRFGQPSDKVRVITFYGVDNQIDGIVLDVLLNKHKNIRNSIGVSVPVPVNTNEVVEAIFEGLLLREERGRSVDGRFEQLVMFEDFLKPRKEELYKEWESAAEREKASRSVFAQHSIKVEEVRNELEAAQRAVGSPTEIEEFVRDVLAVNGGTVSKTAPFNLDLKEAPPALKDMVGGEYEKFKASFSLPVKEGVTYLSRTHPFIENTASFVFNTAMDPGTEGSARRCGVIRTDAVKKRTILLLLRLRFHINTKGNGKKEQLLAEDSMLLAFEGSLKRGVQLEPDAAESLLKAEPKANVDYEQAVVFLKRAVEGIEEVMPILENAAVERGKELLDAHRRVRTSAKIKGVRYEVEPKLPPDVLGVYVYLPLI